MFRTFNGIQFIKSHSLNLDVIMRTQVHKSLCSWFRVVWNQAYRQLLTLKNDVFWTKYIFLRFLQINFEIEKFKSLLACCCCCCLPQSSCLPQLKPERSCASCLLLPLGCWLVHLRAVWVLVGRSQLRFHTVFIDREAVAENISFLIFFSYNQMHGKGVLTQLDGTYRGSFTHNCKEGRGTFCFTNESWLYHVSWVEKK